MSDRDLLVAAIEAEQELAADYGRARGFGEAERFRAHCLEHARGFTELLRNRGGSPPRPRASIGDPQDPRELLAGEDETAAGLLAAVGRTQDTALLPILASALGNHAQHQVVLRQALGRPPLS